MNLYETFSVLLSEHFPDADPIAYTELIEDCVEIFLDAVGESLAA